jgi:putative membrane protein
MSILTSCLVLIVAVEHLYFLILEMFYWTKPKGMKAFGIKSLEFAKETKVLAANQGLYNGFLSAGLIFSMLEQDITMVLFFLSCVIIAGIYGGYSTKQIKLFYIQSIPAILALCSIIVNTI